MEYAGVQDSTLIILAIIGIVPAVLVAILNRRSHRETRDRIEENTTVTKEVRHQVKNDHGTNLRDDIDGFKRTVENTLGEMSRQLESIEAAQGYAGGVIGNILGDVRSLKKQDADTAKAVEILEESVKPLQEALEAYRQRKNT